MKERNALIDATKGLGILLVVLGHAIQHNIADFDNLLFRIIYSFHMPLFMFLSGCVSKYGDPRSITKNITRLVLPFLSWYFIAFILQWKQANLYDHFVKLYQSPDYGLWFLWILFLCHLLFFIMYQVQKYVKLIGVLIVFLAIQFIPLNVLGAGLLKWHFVFFVAGYLTLKYKNYLLKWRYLLIPLVLLNYLFFFHYWQFNSNERLLSAISVFPEIIQKHNSFLERIVRYNVAFSGIGIVFSLVYFLLRFEPIKKRLTVIGLYTMEIYVSHQFFIGLSIGTEVTSKIITGFLIAIFVSLSLAYVLKKIPFVKTVLYGIPRLKAVIRKPVSGS